MLGCAVNSLNRNKRQQKRMGEIKQTQQVHVRIYFKCQKPENATRSNNLEFFKGYLFQY